MASGYSGGMAMGIEIIVLVAVLGAIASIFASTLATGASPLPTSSAAGDTLLEMLPEEINGPVYDLGSGWGGMARALARHYPASTVIGFEVSPLPWAWSWLRRSVYGPDNLTFRYGNFHKTGLEDAALVVCYLPGPVMEKLRPKLEAELKPGALVTSNTFAFQGWTPVATQTAPDMYASQVYLYQVGD